MTSYTGETVGIKCDARDPFTGAHLTNASYVATVDFYTPVKAPKTNLTDRAAPDVADISMTYDATVANKDGTLGAWILYQSTLGAPWIPGKWSYRVTVIGGNYDNFEFGAFTLKT